jgi:hypothetical protein
MAREKQSVADGIRANATQYVFQSYMPYSLGSRNLDVGDSNRYHGVFLVCRCDKHAASHRVFTIKNRRV